MSLPYESSSSGERALGEIQKILRGFGCTKFGSMIDDGAQEVLVQFEYRGRQVSVKASMRGYASAWLKAHPHGPRIRASKVEHERDILRTNTETLAMMLRKCAHRLECNGHEDLSADVVGLLRRYGLIG
jgi:hypothetical protein